MTPPHYPVRAALGRRQLLKAGGAALATAALLAACDQSPAEPAGQPEEGTGGGEPGGGRNPKEAPALASRVKSGELPAVGKRMPEEPLVVKPNDRVGRYGGTWRAAMLGPSDTSWLDRAVGYEYLLRWKPDTVAFTLDDIVPNVARSYQANADGTEYTFTLRPGMRWSDGKPFTVDDIVFAVNDVFLNPKLYPVAPLGLLSAGEPAKIDKVDTNTVRFTFGKPSSLFLHMVASKNSGLKELAALPRHYLEQFHADYNPDVGQLAKEAKVSDWVQLFSLKSDQWANAELPRLHAWAPTADLGKGTTYTLDRNPYYWKTDPQGSQLPYVDRFSNDLISDPEAMLLKATHGDIDFYDRLINTLRNKPVLARNRDQGGYDFFDLRAANMNTAIIEFNLTHQDPVKRAIFQNKDFRIGLSHAINRTEIIKTVYKSLGEPWQVSPLPAWTYYDEKLANQYLAYDVDLANKFLDRAGYRREGGNGLRLGPDGKPIIFKFEMATLDYGFDWASVIELVKQYWHEVGVDINVHTEDSSLLYAHQDANTLEGSVWMGDVGALDAHLDPRYIMPYSTGTNFWSYRWAQWYESLGKEGERPPAPVRRQMAAYDKFKTTVDPDEQARLMREIVRIAQEQFYMIGVSRPTGRYGFATNDFHNVPNNYLESSNYPNPGPTNPEQYFLQS